jgi:O-antigen/teichoic acid export membrane protein
MPAALSKFGAEFLGRGEPWFAETLRRQFQRWQWGGALASALLLAALPQLFGLSPFDWSTIAPVGLLAVAIAISNAQVGTAAAWQEYKLLATTRILQMLLSSSFMITFATLGLSAHWLIFAQAVGIGCGILIFRLWWEPPILRTPQEIPRQLKRRIGRYVLLAFAITLIAMFLWQRVEVMFLQAMATPSEVGFFGVAMTFAAALMRLPGALLGVLTPRFSELVATRERRSIKDLASNSFRMTAFIALPVAGFSSILAEPCLAFFYGPTFIVASQMFRFLICGQFLLLLCHVPRSLLFATNNEHRILLCDFAICAAGLVLQPLAIRFLSGLGAAIANAIVMAMLLFVSASLLRRFARVSLPWRALFRTLWIALIGCSVLLAILATSDSVFALWIGLAACSLIYCLLCLRFGILSREDMSTLGKVCPPFASLLSRCPGIFLPDRPG